MGASHGSLLLIYAVIAIAALILLITRYKVYPFLVLIIVSLLLGLVSGMPIDTIVKLVFDAKYGELLGAHLIGVMATELISELVMAKKLEATEEEILHIMHPHPTFSESIMEAAGQGLGESVHI